MKVGDLVKHRTDPSVGVGVIIDISIHIHDVLVQWPTPPHGETEVNFWHLIGDLEMVSECK